MFEFFLPDLIHRSDEKELMDSHDSNEKKLINTVKQFTLLNKLFSASQKLIKKYIINDMLVSGKDSFTFLDIGSGGCDISIWLLKQCRKKKINIKIYCLDNDKRIIKYAEKKVKDYNEITVIEGSAFNINRYGNFDYMFTNHFMHHFDFNDLCIFIKQVYKNTNRTFVLNDILRSKFAYLGYTLFTGIFLHNSFAFYDGRLSIKKGFNENELVSLIKLCKLNNEIQIIKDSPSRIILLGSKMC